MRRISLRKRSRTTTILQKEEMKRLLTLGIVVCCALTNMVSEAAGIVRSEKKDSSITESFSIYYRCDSVDVDINYLDNREQIPRILHYIKSSPRIDSITIYSYSSPEGRYSHNLKLSQERGKSAKRFLLSHSPDSAKLNAGKIRLSPIAENWEGLIASVEQLYHKDDREAVLSILYDKNISNDVRKWKLKCLNSGKSYRYIIDNYMPPLRAASWVCVWGEVMDPLPQRPMISSRLSGPEPGLVMHDEVSSEKRTVIALKTNLLYDAVTALNFAVEVPIGRRFSILYEHHCPWWLSKSNKYCLQFLSYGGELRWWMSPIYNKKSDGVKRDALTGHFLGLYGWTGKSDIQIDNRLGCYQFEFCSAGLTYGYSMPVGRHLNMEFSISAGYAQVPYRHYIPTDDWSLLIRDDNKTGTLHYIGPTKAEISLVIPIRAKFRGGAKR